MLEPLDEALTLHLAQKGESAMTESSTAADVAASAESPILCPDWCAGDPAEHQFEADHGCPISHFAHDPIQLGLEQPLTVFTEVTVQPDGTIRRRVSVMDDEYDPDSAERLALAILRAVEQVRR